MDITELLALAVERKASDLHLSAAMPPMLRVDGDLCKMHRPALTHQNILKIIDNSTNDKQRKAYEEQLELDFSFEIPGLARCRVNVFHQLRGAAAVFRLIPKQIPTLDELKFPAIFTTMASYPKGLVLITGPAGSGKTTTLAAMIDYINHTRYDHIITIEDPVEFIHDNYNSLINQREVYRDTYGFNAALRSALREDPNVIMVGELRDLETMRLALTAAETGHLVFGTLHTNSATKAIHRMIDAFPGNEKSMVRSLLSESLQAVVAQNLVKKIGGGRVAAVEILICTPAIRHLIREDKIAQMYSAIQTGQSNGMMTFDQHLLQLASNQQIERKRARELALDKSQF